MHRFTWKLARSVVVALTGLAMTTAISSAADAEPVKLGTNRLTAGIPGKGPVTKAEIDKWLANPKNHVELKPELPMGLAAGASQIKGLDKNPLTRAKIELGRQLYFDTRLSADNTVSCASCHHPDEGYGRHTQFGVGIDGQEGGRNSPISYNRILSDLQFWDGRADSLEAQAVGPIANPIEMGNTHDKAVATLKKIPGYVAQFKAVFGGDDAVNIDNVGKAIATFERVIVSGPSPFDYNEAFQPFSKFDDDELAELKEDAPEVYARYETLKKGVQKNPMSEAAKRGKELFFSQEVNCAACHVGANLADEKYHNLGIGADAKEPDVGRFAVTKDPKDWGAFKTPTIRNVALSAPYMHDGSLKTLADTVEHYNKGGTPNKNLSDKVKKLNLNKQQVRDIVAFMKACTGRFPKVQRERLPE
jgi:cytochrome c peroxidase